MNLHFISESSHWNESLYNILKFQRSNSVREYISNHSSPVHSFVGSHVFVHKLIKRNLFHMQNATRVDVNSMVMKMDVRIDS